MQRYGLKTKSMFAKEERRAENYIIGFLAEPISMPNEQSGSRGLPLNICATSLQPQSHLSALMQPLQALGLHWPLENKFQYTTSEIIGSSRT